jgi:hypothetical protein
VALSWRRQHNKDVCSLAFVATKFTEVFAASGIPDDVQDGPQNIGSIQTPDVADSLRRLHRQQ